MNVRSIVGQIGQWAGLAGSTAGTYLSVHDKDARFVTIAMIAAIAWGVGCKIKYYTTRMEDQSSGRDHSLSRASRSDREGGIPQRGIGSVPSMLRRILRRIF